MSKFKNKFSLKEVREHWNSVSKVYDESNKEHDETHDQRFIEAVKYICPASNIIILDMYSRTGDSIKYLTAQCDDIKIIGTELSEGMIIRAKQKYPENMFVHASPHNLPYKDESFDVVLSLESLEHVTDPYIFLLEIKRVLKPHGTLVLSLPPSTAEYTSILVDLFHLHHGEGPHKFLHSKTVKKIIEKVGLKLIKHKGTLLIPVGPKLLKDFGARIEDRIQNTFLREFCIRQFYICVKGD